MNIWVLVNGQVVGGVVVPDRDLTDTQEAAIRFMILEEVGGFESRTQERRFDSWYDNALYDLVYLGKKESMPFCHESSGRYVRIATS